MALYQNIYLSSNPTTKIENLLSVTVNGSHASSTTVAVIESSDCPFALGNYIKIDLGYDTSHGQIFTGYVTSIEYKVPENTYTITANDDLVRALYYFVVAANPNNLLTYSNISAENLVSNLLGLASLTDTHLHSTGFTFGVNNSFTVNQVSVYDYCRTITDLLALNLWCDEFGVIHLEAIEPYVSGDPAVIAYTWDDTTKTLDFTFHEDEKNLRNRVVVYGANGISAEAIDSDSPYFHWKTAILVATDLLDTQEMVDQTANYNLTLFNRLTKTASGTVVGDYTILPHRYITVNMHNPPTGDLDYNGKYYIYSVEHRMDSGGYITSMELRK